MATTRRKMNLGSATCYAVLTEHESGKYTIAVEVPGLPPRPDNDHSYDTEGQAMAAAEALASSLVMHLN